MSKILGPGSTIGILGSGQLGRMLALAARRLGYAIQVYSPDTNSPCGQVADVSHTGPYDDLDAVARFAQQVDVVTFEFENVPLATAEAAERHAPVRPSGQVLYTTQHRLREKQFLRDAGIATARFAPITAAEQIPTALAQVGLPAILKTAAFGYDGKGQRRVGSLQEAEQAWRELNQQPLVAEEFVSFSHEVSVVAVRGGDGQFAHYGPIHNLHRRHILDLSICPADLPPALATQAVEIARTIVDRLRVVGVLCVEYFVTTGGAVLVNELAPRPHNSGHLTIEAHRTSQFEQQLRAICNMPLGSTRQLRPAAMANLLGDLWQAGEPHWERVLAARRAYLHLYGKDVPQPGRKMGHLTVVGPTSARAARSARALRAAAARQDAAVVECNEPTAHAE